MSPSQNGIPFVIRRKIQLFALVALGLCLCWLIMLLFAAEVVGLIVLILSLLVVAAWVFFANNAWWVMLPIMFCFGGFFYVGFRIDTHELALLLCGIALLPALATKQVHRKDRDPIPLSAWLLLAYLVCHFAVSAYWVLENQTGGMGNVLRVYVRGMWPLCFLIMFWWYGDTKYLKHVLAAMYAVCLVRVVFGIIGYYSPRLLYLPGINFVFMAAYTEGADLRSSTLLLVSLALCYSSFSRSKVLRILHMLVVCSGAWLILIGGSRVSFAIFWALLMLWALFSRRFFMLGGAVAALSVIILVLNWYPHLVYRMPPRIQRTMSIIAQSSHSTSLKNMTRLSDKWHYILIDRGIANWTRTPGSMLAGNRVYPFDASTYRAISADMYMRTHIAARMGSYESGLWTVLAVLGIIGAILYALLWRHLLSGVLPALIKGGIRDRAHAYYFLAVSSAIIWLVFCWIAGHFPSRELMMATIARAAYIDTVRKQKKDEDDPRPDENTTAAGL